MKPHFIILVGLSIPTGVMLIDSLAAWKRERSAAALFQWLGAACLSMVMLAHAAEIFHLLPGMGWGLSSSPGHYLDLTSAALALILLPIGYGRRLYTRHANDMRRPTLPAA